MSFDHLLANNFLQRVRFQAAGTIVFGYRIHMSEWDLRLSCACSAHTGTEKNDSDHYQCANDRYHRGCNGQTFPMSFVADFAVKFLCVLSSGRSSEKRQQKTQHNCNGSRATRGRSITKLYVISQWAPEQAICELKQIKFSLQLAVGDRVAVCALSHSSHTDWLPYHAAHRQIKFDSSSRQKKTKRSRCDKQRISCLQKIC